MVKTGHTSGPWTVDDLGVVRSVTSNAVAKVYVRSDYCLVAAAPDLLEALIELTEEAKYEVMPNRTDDLSVAVSKAREAIAKATNKPEAKRNYRSEYQHEFLPTNKPEGSDGR